MNKLTGTVMAGLAVFAFSGMAVSVNAAESTGKTTAQGARDDSAGGPNSGSDTANDPGSQGTQSGETPSGNAGGNTGSRDSSNAQQPGSDTAGDTGSRGTQSGETPGQSSNEQFAAEMRKCNAMSGTQKSSCVDAAKKKHGQM